LRPFPEVFFIYKKSYSNLNFKALIEIMNESIEPSMQREVVCLIRYFLEINKLDKDDMNAKFFVRQARNILICFKKMTIGILYKSSFRSVKEYCWLKNTVILNSW